MECFSEDLFHHAVEIVQIYSTCVAMQYLIRHLVFFLSLYTCISANQVSNAYACTATSPVADIASVYMMCCEILGYPSIYKETT